MSVYETLTDDEIREILQGYGISENSIEILISWANIIEGSEEE